MTLPATLPLLPFSHTSGPREAKIVVVGEAWGQSEQELRRPFVGESGKELFLMLGEAMPDIAPELHSEVVELFRYGLAWAKRRDEWLAAASILLTNVFNLRPPGNKIEELCGKKADMPSDYSLPMLSQGKYIRPEFLPQVERLEAELEAVRPNLVLCMGNSACWAVLRQTNIGSIRGTITRTPQGLKALPTYHPAGVLRQWAWRPIVVADLMKARRESAFPEVRRPERQILVSPTLPELREWVEKLLASPPPLLAADTETKGGQITCIGFAPSRTSAIVIPFYDPKAEGKSFWATPEEELEAWTLVARVLESPVHKVWQNGLYDFQYVLPMGIKLVNCTEDLMLLHHSILPEVKKGLGFLGSIYTSEPAWKLMRLEKADTEKKDE